MNILEQFKSDLQKLGIKSGDSIMMHCSYKSLGVKIDPQAFFTEFMEVLGEEGTLILPAFSYDTVNYENPIFDKAKTPSCIGYLPEFFRTKVSGVKRSLHASHSCAVLGKNAEFLIKDHEKDLTPVGKNSPITKLPEINGKILILGSHPDHNTAMHGVEEKGGAPYVLNLENPIKYTLIDGETEIHQTAYRHYFNRDGYYYSQEYARIINLLTKNKDYVFGKVLNADCYLFDAKALWEKGVAKIKQEPYYFTEKVDIE